MFAIRAIGRTSKRQFFPPYGIAPLLRGRFSPPPVRREPAPGNPARAQGFGPPLSRARRRAPGWGKTVAAGLTFPALSGNSQASS